LWLHNGGAAPVAMATINGELEPREEILVDPPAQVSAFFDKHAQTVYISWLPPATGANGYHVYISTAPEGPFELRATVGDSSYTDEGPLAAGTYWYMVKTFRVDKLEEEYTSEASSLTDATLDTPIGNQPPIFLCEPLWVGPWVKLSTNPAAPHIPQSQHILFWAIDDDGKDCESGPNQSANRLMYRPVELQDGEVVSLDDWTVQPPNNQYLWYIWITEPGISDITGSGLFEIKTEVTDCTGLTVSSEEFYGQRYYILVE